MKIQSLDAKPDILATDAVIFTSSNGVAHAPKGRGQAAYCVGAATTEAARKAGWQAQMRGENAEQLILSLSTKPPAERLVHLSGVHTRGDICDRLSARGLQAVNIPVYDQIAQSLSPDAHKVLADRHLVIAPLFSPRTAAQFAAEVPRAQQVHAIVLSNAVAQSLEQASYATVIVSSSPDVDAMVAAIVTVLSDLPAG